jgi:hypothetical protein
VSKTGYMNCDNLGAGSPPRVNWLFVNSMENPYGNLGVSRSIMYELAQPG